MSGLTEQQVLAALRQVVDPDRGKDIVSLGMVSGVQLREGHVGFAVEVDPQRGPKLEPLRRAAEQAVEALAGVLSVTAVLTAQKAPGGAAPRPAQAHGHAHGQKQGAAAKPMVPGGRAVIVSTPQDIALLDARKGLNMFRKVDVPVLGIVENMSYFLCPHCGERSEIFSHGGARREAERLGAEFLGEVPLHISIRETSDEGRPIVVSQPESAPAQIFRRMASRIAEKLGSAKRQAPRIVVE